MNSSNHRSDARLARAKLASASNDEELKRKREMVAELCRYMGAQLTGGEHVSAREAREAAEVAKAAARLPRRERQTFQRLLVGDSEKQIAYKLGISQHTIHFYIKCIYRRFGVCARSELFARVFRQPATDAEKPASQVPSSF